MMPSGKGDGSDGLAYRHTHGDRLHGRTPAGRHQRAGCRRQGLYLPVLPPERLLADDRLRNRGVHPQPQTPSGGAGPPGDAGQGHRHRPPVLLRDPGELHQGILPLPRRHTLAGPRRSRRQNLSSPDNQTIGTGRHPDGLQDRSDVPVQGHRFPERIRQRDRIRGNPQVLG